MALISQTFILSEHDHFDFQEAALPSTIIVSHNFKRGVGDNGGGMHPVKTFVYKGNETGGTKGADSLIGSGTVGAIYFGGDGNDDVNPGIVLQTAGLPKLYTIAYGGVSLPDKPGLTWGHLPGFTHGKKGAIGGLAHDGKDTGHFGVNIEIKLGSDADTTIWHGFGSTDGKQLPGKAVQQAPGEGDEIYLPMTEWWSLSKIEAKSKFTVDGQKFVSIDDFYFEGGNKGNIKYANAFVGFHDDGRGPSSTHQVVIPYAGKSYNDETKAAWKDWSTPGEQFYDKFAGAGADDQWVNPL